MKVPASLCGVALFFLAGISLAAQTDLRHGFDELASRCAPGVHPRTMRALVSVESSHNPYAIGVVKGRLDRQPMTLAEALATVRQLEQQGYNFSLGLAQVNRYNLARLGESYETIFDSCRNLRAGAQVLRECFAKAKGPYHDDQVAVRAALSCYYSGNFSRGFRAEGNNGPSYVEKVVARAGAVDTTAVTVPEILPRGGEAVEPPPTKPAWVTLVGGEAAPAVATPHPAEPAATTAQEPAVVVQLASNVPSPAPAASRRPLESAIAVPNATPTINDTPFVQFVDSSQ